ncbi:hypothetical protein CBL_03046 [Carabus blaptoides fortunei]
MGCSAEEAKKKMDSMLASFRREKGKRKTSVRTGKGKHKMYVSKWFAFNRMAFLLNRDEPKDMLDSMEKEASLDEEPECVLEQKEEEEDVDNTQSFQNDETDTKILQTIAQKFVPTPTTGKHGNQPYVKRSECPEFLFSLFVCTLLVLFV